MDDAVQMVDVFTKLVGQRGQVFLVGHVQLENHRFAGRVA